MRTLAGSVLFAAGLAAPAQPFPASTLERAQVFASCAGSYSALTEHQFIFDGPASERSAERRDLFVQMLEAVLPDAIGQGLPGTQAMSWRIEAKAVQAALLRRAAFQTDPLIAEPARAAAEARIAGCGALLLGA